MLFRYGWYNTRFEYASNMATQTDSKYGSAINELSDYESENIYKVIQEFPDLLRDFGRIGSYDDLGVILINEYPVLFQSYILNDSIYDPNVLSYIKNNSGTIKYELTNVVSSTPRLRKKTIKYLKR